MKKSGMMRGQTTFLVEVTRHRQLEMVLEVLAAGGRQTSAPDLKGMEIRSNESVVN